MGVDPGPAQLLRHRVVERLQRSPTAVQEVVPPGVQLPSRRHARQRSGVAAVERDRPLGQPLEVGGDDRVRPVRRQQVPVQAVEHDHDRSHRVTFRVGSGVGVGSVDVRSGSRPSSRSSRSSIRVRMWRVDGGGAVAMGPVVDRDRELGVERDRRLVLLGAVAVPVLRDLPLPGLDLRVEQGQKLINGEEAGEVQPDPEVRVLEAGRRLVRTGEPVQEHGRALGGDPIDLGVLRAGPALHRETDPVPLGHRRQRAVDLAHLRVGPEEAAVGVHELLQVITGPRAAQQGAEQDVFEFHRRSSRVVHKWNGLRFPLVE